MRSYKRYLEAEHNINQGLIRRALSYAQENKRPRDPEAKMREMASFLKSCGNPEREVPTIHVGGTSGKGSVAAHIAGILTQAGFRTGLHVSPYLQSATEKIWLADHFVSADEFADLVNWVMPIAKPRVSHETMASIHGMASVAITLEAFRRARVDIAVIEVGCGGRYDLTSFVETKVAVVTNVGMDHVVSLGPDIAQIAWHKAGIARGHTPLVTGATGPALEVIRREADTVNAKLITIPPPKNVFAHNRELAIEAARQAASGFGVTLSESTIDSGIERVALAGRSEIMPESKARVILDGAHNGEKISAAVQAALAKSNRGPRVCIIGLIGSKASPDVVRALEGRFDKVITTEPVVYAKSPNLASATAELLKQVGYKAEIITDYSAALNRAIEIAKPDGTILVTGSFYLVGNVRERWFPKEQIVLNRTSWPII